MHGRIAAGPVADGWWLSGVFWLSGALACDGSNVEVFENGGSLCFTQTQSQVQIRASVDACIGNCRRLRKAHCEAQLTADGLVVSTRLEVEETEGPCTTECSPEGADCAFTAPGDGRLRVSYGEEEATLDLPLTDRASLFGRFECAELE